MDVRLLFLVDASDPSFHIDVTHLLSRDGFLLQDHVRCVPDDNTEVIPAWEITYINHLEPKHSWVISPQRARFMGPTWGPPGDDRTQVGPMLTPWTLLSGTTWSIFFRILPIDPPHCWPVSANSDLYSASVTAVLYALSTGVCYNSTWL